MASKDVLLLYPSYSYPRKSPPLGLAYLAAYIEQAGYQPHVYDFNITPLSKEQLVGLLDSQAWLLVGISFMTNQFAEARILADTIKKHSPQIPLVAGGPHPSSIPERTLLEIRDFDMIVVGEGEETLKDLCDSLRYDRDLAEVNGLCYRKDSDILMNKKRELILDLDKHPFPAWKFFNLEKYNVFSIAKNNDGAVFAMLSSRGCPNHCTFCDSHTIFQRKFRGRSAENIYEEIMFLHEKYGLIEFDFVDDLVTIHKNRIIVLSKLLKNTGIPFRWMANARVNTVDREMLQAMKDAGCIRVDFGVETGDLKVREMMRKKITNEQIRNAHYLAHDIGLSTGSFAMVGNLGETKKSAKMTVELLKDIGDDVMVSIACPFPGTELYEKAKAKGLVNTEDWTRYVTSPTYTDNYWPVMRTEGMSEGEILDSFYYIHSFFAKRKFQRRYGRNFLFNPKFYREWFFQREGFGNRLKMAMRLLSSRVKMEIL